MTPTGKKPVDRRHDRTHARGAICRMTLAEGGGTVSEGRLASVFSLLARCEKSLKASINKFKKRVSESVGIIKAEKLSDGQLTEEKLLEIWEQVKDLLKKNDA